MATGHGLGARTNLNGVRVIGLNTPLNIGYSRRTARFVGRSSFGVMANFLARETPAL